MTNKPEATPGLKDTVQSFRDKAREVLRMEMISDLLQDLFYADKNMSNVVKSREQIEKEEAVLNYELGKLDKDHPNYEQSKENKEKKLKYTEEEKETNEKAKERAQKEINAINKDIEKIESGETPVSIDAVKALTDKFISQS